jgi:L-alanine-DL-glutamate epimerase-like enolase superfamily enzyme
VRAGLDGGAPATSTPHRRPGAPSNGAAHPVRARNGQSVEALLGLPAPGGPHRYSAVLGNDEPWKTRFLIDQYLILGLTDFKVKLGGDLEVDRKKLRSIAELSRWHGIQTQRVRVDANNLWADQPERALEYLRELDCELFGVEEPVKPRDAEMHSRIGVDLGVPIILDESLCTMADWALRRPAGRFIANPGGVGGVLRALDLVSPARRAGRSSSARTSARPRC